MTEIQLPDWGEPLFEDWWRYMLLYGGRGSAKSHTVAASLVVRAATRTTRFLCVREFQNSIDDSAKQLLEDKIYDMQMHGRFKITKYGIEHRQTGSTFRFRGMSKPGSLRGTEGIDVVWGDEAQDFSRKSLRSLIPTIRKPGSQLIFTLNPQTPQDAIWKLIEKLQGDPKAILRLVNWRDNPWFPEILNDERLRDLRRDKDEYQHIWEGQFLSRSNALIMSDRCQLGLEFDCPPAWDTDDGRYYYGADFGFAADPNVLIRAWIKDRYLWVDRAAFGYGIELPDIARMYDTVPGARDWPILADSARPDIISMLRNLGFNIEGAPKGPGSIEDGIAFLRSFNGIKVHKRCTEFQEECLRYSYKVDKKTEQVLPVVESGFDHGWDALRYAFALLAKSMNGLVVSDEEMDDLDLI